MVGGGTGDSEEDDVHLDGGELIGLPPLQLSGSIWLSPRCRGSRRVFPRLRSRK